MRGFVLLATILSAITSGCTADAVNLSRLKVSAVNQNGQSVADVTVSIAALDGLGLSIESKRIAGPNQSADFKLRAGRYRVICMAPRHTPSAPTDVSLQENDVRAVRCLLVETKTNEQKMLGDKKSAKRPKLARHSPALILEGEELKNDAVSTAKPPSPALQPRARPRRKSAKRMEPMPAASEPMRGLGAVGSGYGGAGLARTRVARRQAVPTKHYFSKPESDSEAYDKIEGQDFKMAQTDPLSTFSIDVDTASMTNARRYIERMDRMPPQDSVRIEEFINYFEYDYATPKGDVPFAVHTEVSKAPWQPEHMLVKIGLQGEKVDTTDLPPSNLVFLIDVSGSMNNRNKLPLLKKAFGMLVNNLRPQDRVAIVVYASATGLVLPSTSGAQKSVILNALNQLQAGGSTAGGAGIQLAYKTARENFVEGGVNRVILATDGDFNVGVTSRGGLERLIEQERKSGVFLTILGFGRGNYKDARMEQLSNKGNGNAAYIDNLLEAKKVLVTEMGATLMTIAKDVKIQVEFNPAYVKGYRLIGYENRALANRDFNDDKKDAGELGAGHRVTALYEIIPANSKSQIIGTDMLKYQTKALSKNAEESDELMTVKLRYKTPTGSRSKLVSHPVKNEVQPLEKTSASFRFASSVAEFAMLLRDSKYRGQSSYASVLKRAGSALGRDQHGYRQAFMQMVRRAEAIAEASGHASIRPKKTLNIATQ